MIHFYHGLFGSPTDWDGMISTDLPVVQHDLYGESLTSLLELETDRESILIGYSMGGRIALDILIHNGFLFSKLILISAHPGLPAEEIGNRLLWEEEVMDRLMFSSVDEFTDYWNSLPLFRRSKLERTLTPDILSESLFLFQKLRLSKQPNYAASIAEHAGKIVYIYGNHDEKYKQIALHCMKPAGVKVYEVDSDHRALKDRKAIQEILRAEILP